MTKSGRDGRYRLGLESRELDSDGLIDLLLGWIAKYPIVSIEDPLAEDDVEGFTRFTQAIGHRFTTFDDPDILCELDAVGDLSNAWVKTDTRKATHELAYVARGYAGMNAEMIAVFQPKTP